jgi:ATP-dependent 26S proteasome regulatory subunit
LQTIFLPVVGLVPTEKLQPGDLVGVNKDSYLILEMLPSEYVYFGGESKKPKKPKKNKNQKLLSNFFFEFLGFD